MIDVRFYQSAAGRYPLKQWLDRLSKDERLRILVAIDNFKSQGMKLLPANLKKLEITSMSCGFYTKISGTEFSYFSANTIKQFYSME